jgi:hypothetical protein
MVVVHQSLLRGFPVGHHHDNLAIGIAIHHFAYCYYLTTFFINSHLNKTTFAFMITFAIMTPLGTFVSDYFPVLNQYTTQITAVVIGYSIFHPIIFLK